MYRDFKELLSVLNAHRVKYLIVGGYAVSLHAEPRATKDLDVLIGPAAENGKAVFAALAAFGAPLEQDLADAAALGEHLDPVEHRSHDVEAPSVADMETTRKKAVADWLAYRAQREAEDGSPSLEERRAKAVENWKRLQKQKAQGSDVGRSSPKKDRSQDKARNEQARDRGKDAAEDPDLD